MSVECVIKAAMGVETNTNFDANVTIASLRPRFYAMTGYEPSSMKIKVNGNLIEDESLPLSTYATGSPLVIEISGKSEFGDLNDVNAVKKYEISDADYDHRTGTIREMKRKAGIPVKGEVHHKYDDVPQGIEVGNRCQIEMSDHSHHRGCVRYVGKVEKSNGYWIGVQLDEPYGKNDGSLDGKRYFECENKYGVFVRAEKVEVGDFPEIDWEAELEDEM
ncbi:CAP-Gly domain containing protein [Trichomonas vaginalis G3]|uniref:CAP-Gly domain containing protein n=1 Tax=Trichomonas vaginalis (strain ATCC PRA-98 / G3) TaxID=412133 RepID=A2DTR7_TRIV3|nr:cell differentiation protein family [Trichomonas vaginalis G3]EAY16214.1 CAP-Gly domain containing protein [Trichomonas vaginalis G3]KAI5493286.1 cell differentiation protein family [Trichomonas vaginalis G3]|eukprot:XP_001328437.1 CAP-Gly domain containing protein [Trichomonas vaginalis G3]